MAEDFKLDAAVANKARKAWKVAHQAWSREDHTDARRAMMVGEAMMFAATDLICHLDDLAEVLRLNAEWEIADIKANVRDYY